MRTWWTQAHAVRNHFNQFIGHTVACLVGDTSFPAISSTWLNRNFLNRCITEFNNEMPLTENWVFNLVILHYWHYFPILILCSYFFFFLLSTIFIFIFFDTQHNRISKTKQQTHTQHLKVQSKGRERGKDNKNTKVTPYVYSTKNTAKPQWLKAWLHRLVPLYTHMRQFAGGYGSNMPLYTCVV